MMKLLKVNSTKKSFNRQKILPENILLTKNTTGEYIIEKILRTKGNQIYVKWRGYSNNFNS